MFRFKQFAVEHQRSSMKVGTDAVLLGAWANCYSAQSILDIGTGSGVIGLLLAQRSSAHITAIDMHEASISEARRNFANSPWNTRLTAVHSRLQDYYPRTKFDLIVSNPPFFRNCLKVPDPIRNQARHDDTLAFEELLIGIDRLMTLDGSFTVILPMAEYITFENLAQKTPFYPSNLLRVFSTPGKPCRRVLATFEREHKACLISELAIHNSDGTFTTAYKQLTTEFYLEF
jgi:tRNA1Val (adenine37-N6)-methyltransferase